MDVMWLVRDWCNVIRLATEDGTIGDNELSDLFNGAYGHNIISRLTAL
jgi:hypothetical protein